MENPATNPTEHRGPRIWTVVWMIVSQLLTLVFSLPSVGFMVFGTLLEGSSALKLDFWNVMYWLPVLNILPMIAAWVAFAQRKNRLALILTSVTLALACLEGGGFIALLTGIIVPP